jgi:seryl-tRNA synthetase
MPIDINLLRKEKGGDPDKVRQSQRDRFADETLVDQVIEIDENWRKSNYKMETLKMEFNAVNKDIANRKKASKGQDKCEDLVEKSKDMKAQIDAAQKEAEDLDKLRAQKLNLIGNIVDDRVPKFKEEDNNEVIKTWGEKSPLKVDGKTIGQLHHHEVMGLLDMVEFERGQKVAGHRGYYLKGVGVLLNQALINLGLATLVKDQYIPLQPPFFIKSSIMHETCQLSDFEENLYKVEGGDDKEPYFMIATSEQPISAMHRGEWIEPQDLPMRYGGISSCFRKEAGSHGRDVWGIFRVHQFEKVEQFVYSAPDKSWEELDKMISTSEKFYQALNLPYQVIKIVSGGLNDAAAMKMDLEAWFPGYEAYRELVSCSNCTDYQARALDVRYSIKNLEKGQSTPFVHMLNGTLCATERTMCCIVENYQTPEGLRIPEALQPFMGGLEFIKYDEKKVKAWQEKIADEEKKAAAKDAKKKN